MRSLRVPHAFVLLACTALLMPTYLRAQDQSASSTLRLELSSADRAAAESSSNYRVHTRLVKTGLNRYSPLPGAAASLRAAGSALTRNFGEFTVNAASTIPAVPVPGFYPDDLSHPLGGPVVASAQSHAVYVDCAATCWGSPAKFLDNLGKSDFIHVVDQYVGSTADNRYKVGTPAVINYPIFTTLADSDVLQIAHSAAASLGTGYHHIYHIFLPKGVDLCFTGTSQCYSPDNNPTFYFCAYHGSVTFSDIGHVLFTVEPYQNVAGCGILQPSPNGGVVDSTSNVLGHETFETITDPDPPTGWIAVTSNGVFGEEIGDLCPGVSLTAPYFQDPVTEINGMKYEVQPMYSNTYHACSYAP